jgi:hypothetical protein
VTTSGTYDTVEFTVAKLLDRAALRCRKPTSQISAEDIQTAIDEFNITLKAEYSNRGLKLWTIEQSNYGLYVGQRAYPVDVNTIDIKNANLRTVERLNSDNSSSSDGGTIEYAFDGDTSTILTQTAPDGNIVTDFTDAVSVHFVGILPGASATMHYVVEASDDDVTYDTYYDIGSTAYVNGDWAWYDLPISQARSFWRLRETGGGTISLRELVWADITTDIPLYRLNRDDYSNLPNKSFGGRPTQYWWNRVLPAPEMVLWPVPNDTFNVLNVFRTREIQDVTSIRQTIEAPRRWWSALVEGLAEKLLRCGVGEYALLPDVQKALGVALALAENEEQDSGVVFVTPNISGYTR